MHNWSVWPAHSAKLNVLCANLTAHLTYSESEILDFVACEILNFEHCSYLTANLDSVLRSATIDISLEFSSTLIEACTTGQFDPHTVTRTLRRAKFSILCSYLTAPLTSDINVSKILNFNHYSYLTAHLDSVWEEQKRNSSFYIISKILMYS